MKSVSIALCTYNGEKYLSEQLESIKNQTILPDELVICDDGSTDATVSIVREFSQTAPFEVKLFVNEKNLRVTKNFEKAINKCEGEIIFLSDQDDVWRADKIEVCQKHFAESESVGLVFTNADIVDENLKSLGKNLWDFTFPASVRRFAAKRSLFEVLLQYNVVTGATAAFRKNLIDAFLPIPETIPNTIHDGWIALVLAAVSEVVFIDQNLILYRQHPQQQIGIDGTYRRTARNLTRRQDYENALEIQENYLERYTQLKKEIDYEKIFRNRLPTKVYESLLDRYYKETLERVRHIHARKDLSAHNHRRIVPIISELMTGRYHRFSKGLRSAAKDLFQKW